MINFNHFIFDSSTSINFGIERSKAVEHGLSMLARDWEKVFGQKLLIDRKSSYYIHLRYPTQDDLSILDPEGFVIDFREKDDSLSMEIIAENDLGFVYGLLHISKTYLEVDPLWFWADLEPIAKESAIVKLESYQSPKYEVRYRGWFVNDEVCLLGWKEEYPPNKEVWLPVFEALLRMGGNMVIPGTDLPKTGVHQQLASEMGLWVTHHHAEPLGAEMFLRAFPYEKASYKQNKDLYEQLWKEAIREQKDDQILWVLSFRGQGDTPFWSTDPEFDTPKKRGEMISKVIFRQYELIQQQVKNPVCCIALYGEISELYGDGHIDLPENVIKVWADNGYGKMVSRRQGNENLRKYALPNDDDEGNHGIYYHVTFHDLQASNHLTMSPVSPDLLIEELKKSFQARANHYVLVNSGNIRQHLYTLDMVAELWEKGNVNQTEHLDEFLQRLFPENTSMIKSLYQRYFKATIPYGKHLDDRVGDEFYHHPARKIISHYLQNKQSESLEKLHWATGDVSFEEQLQWFEKRCKDGLDEWTALKEDSMEVLKEMDELNGKRFFDQFVGQVILHQTGCEGFHYLTKAVQLAISDHMPQAFIQATKAYLSYKKGQEALEQMEHGKWEHFYRADWLTNVQSTVDNVDTLKRFIRMQGDSPDFFAWYKEYIMPESEKHIYLENTHRRVRSDEELADLLEKEFKHRVPSRDIH
ncbi:glycosyl hydrolase 115 family protein [Alkalihalobacillus trypoxylicola]|uniref:Glycosyl hydrolase family 115 n=1 Tax=Alkalihalobacillus trypoxylicola TaxID=519424 RepID=A0A161P691_9BACI|nr:glycosyl hydrolase 115 family protein [Alkalihalobacillus trypoxylicola]KYG26581.1 hypothetical protein AZF04_12270 [Alkalihalobacillus trypoxylicola]